LLSRLKPLLAKTEKLPINSVSNWRSFLISNASTFLNNDLLIVIDDLERHSPTVSVTDVMGFLLQLRDERRCQIILVMNEEALKDSGGAEVYLANKEKIIDVELTFTPTTDEAVAIVFSASKDNEIAANCCRKLNISNIRTIKKIQDHLVRFRAIVKSSGINPPPEFDAQVQSTMALAVWSYWQQIVALDEIKQLGPGDIWQLHFKESKLEERKRNVYQLLERYGYSLTDNTDRLVIKFVEQGVLESAELTATIAEFAEELARRLRASNVNDAWELYRSSLSDNTDAVAVADALYNSHLAAIEEVEMSSLDAAIRIISELGFQTKANELIERLVHRTNPLPDYERFPLLDLVRDKTLRERWKAASADLPDDRAISETINSFVGPSRDFRRDLVRLSTFTESDFYDYFKAGRIENLFTRIKSLSRIDRSLPDLLDKNEQIEGNVKAALARISAGSKINEIRLRNLLE
jgi:adenylate cyclase class IV